MKPELRHRCGQCFAPLEVEIEPFSEFYWSVAVKPCISCANQDRIMGYGIGLMAEPPYDGIAEKLLREE